MTAIEIFRQLGKKERLLLARRDDHAIRAHFCGADGHRIYDTTVSNRVLQLCDRYASKVRK